mmetsp:Transcript_21688/g.26690  ORF Transcript_21688/g.26690 Transcript_21688/m.26690 type:complete len:211 (-) Transcript_21688:1388-2020(-)
MSHFLYFMLEGVSEVSHFDRLLNKLLFVRTGLIIKLNDGVEGLIRADAHIDGFGLRFARGTIGGLEAIEQATRAILIELERIERLHLLAIVLELFPSRQFCGIFFLLLIPTKVVLSLLLVDAVRGRRRGLLGSGSVQGQTVLACRRHVHGGLLRRCHRLVDHRFSLVLVDAVLRQEVSLAQVCLQALLLFMLVKLAHDHRVHCCSALLLR